MRAVIVVLAIALFAAGAAGMYGDVIEEIDWSVGKLLDALGQ